MTRRDIDILNWINCEGLDNSQWGIHINCGDTLVSEMYDVDKGGEDLCPEKHIYVWADNDTVQRMKIQLGYGGVKPDAEYLTTDGVDTVLLFDVTE